MITYLKLCESYMSNTFDIVISLIEVFNFTAFIVYFLDCSIFKKCIIGILCYISLCTISLVLADSIATGYISFLVVTTSFLFVKINSVNDISSSLLIALFPDLITALINSLILIFASVLVYGTVDFNALMTTHGILVTITTKCIQILLFVLIAHYIKKTLHKLRKNEIYLIDIMIIISIITIDSIEGLLYLGEYSSIYLSAVIVSQVLLSFLLIAVIQSIVNRNEEDRRNELNRQLLKSQVKSINTMIASEQELRELRHTVQHLLSSLPTDDSYDTAQLQNELSAVCIPITTKYPVLNTIINIKREQAAGKGIKMSLNLNVVKLPVLEDDDMYVLLVNLLDNAIEHIGSERRIDVTIKSIQDSFFIHIDNSIDTYTLNADGTLPVNKNGEHGFGTRTIETIVKKYNGLLKYEEENYVFSVRILFPFNSDILQLKAYQCMTNANKKKTE